MKPVHVLQVDGTQYRAIVRSSSVGGLDPLAEFFLERVLPIEARISHLMNLFGLPSRVIEDILADLLKQNRVTLNLRDGEIIVLDQPPGRRLYRNGGEINMWQDEHTGAILPMRVVRPYLVRRKGATIDLLPKSFAARRIPKLLDLPHSRILSMLVPLDPGLRVNTDGWVPDSLLDTKPVDRQRIFVPLIGITIEGRAVQFVDAPTLPYWLTKAWSRDLETVPPEAGQLIDEAIASRVLSPANPSEEILERGTEAEIARSESAQQSRRNRSLFESSDPRTFINDWRYAIEDLIDAAPEVRSLLSRLHRVDVRRRVLVAQLRFRGKVRLLQSSPSCHIAELWQTAKRHLVIVSPEWSQELLQQVASATISTEDRAAHLILIDSSGRGTPVMLDSFRSSFKKTSWGEIETAATTVAIDSAFCLVDGRYARLGSLKTILLRNDSAIEISGVGGIQSLSASVAEWIDMKGSGWWIVDILKVFDAPTDGPIEESIKSLNSRLQLLQDDIQARIDTVNDDRSPKEQMTQKPLSEQDYSLKTRADEIAEDLFALQIQMPAAMRSAFETLSQCCDWVLRQDRQHELELIVPALPRDIYKAVGKVLLDILHAGTRVRIYLGSGAASKSVDRLRNVHPDLLEHPLFSWCVSAFQLPNILIVDERIVAVASRSWFQPSQQTDSGVVVHSESLANEIRALAEARKTK